MIRKPNPSWLTTAVLAAFMLAGVSAAQTVYYVDTGVVGGAADGSSWANAYATLAAAEDARDGNITSVSSGVRFQCRCSTGVADTTAVTFTGWTTDADSPIIVQSDDRSYVIAVTNGTAIVLAEEYINLVGITIKSLAPTASGKDCVTTSSLGTSKFNISYCTFVGGADTSGFYQRGYSSTDADCSADIWNCLFYGFGTASTSAANAPVRIYLGATINVSACTMVGGRNSISVSAGTVTAKNVLATGTGNYSFYNAGGTCTALYCMADDSSFANNDWGAETGCVDGASISYTAAYHLVDGSVAMDAGMNLSEDTPAVTTDKDGATRYGYYDIGCYEVSGLYYVWPGATGAGTGADWANAYTTLDAAVLAKRTNLVTRAKNIYFECSGVGTGTTQADDTTVVSHLSSYTTSDAYRITIRSTDRTYRLIVDGSDATASAVTLGEEYVDLVGLYIQQTNVVSLPGGNVQAVINTTGANASQYNISYCTIVGANSEYYRQRGLVVYGPPDTHNVSLNMWNCLFYDFGTKNPSDTNCCMSVYLADTVRIDNCTFIGGNAGLYVSDGTVYCKNVLAVGNGAGDAFSITDNVGSTASLDCQNCFCDDNSFYYQIDSYRVIPPYITATNCGDKTFNQFTADYRIAAGSWAINKGSNFPTDPDFKVTDDIDGNTREDTFDAGCSEWDWKTYAPIYEAPMMIYFVYPAQRMSGQNIPVGEFPASEGTFVINNLTTILTVPAITHVIFFTGNKWDNDWLSDTEFVNCLKTCIANTKAAGKKVVLSRNMWAVTKATLEGEGFDEFIMGDSDYYIETITELKAQVAAYGADYSCIDTEAYGNNTTSPVKKYFATSPGLTNSEEVAMLNAVATAIASVGKTDFVYPCGGLLGNRAMKMSARWGTYRIEESSYYDKIVAMTYPYDIKGIYISDDKNITVPWSNPFFLPREIYERSSQWNGKIGIFLYPQENKVAEVAALMAAWYSNPVPPSTGTVGTPITYKFLPRRSDMGASPTYSIVSGTCPVGASIDASTGVFAWTPAQPNKLTIQVKITDGTHEEIQPWTITIYSGGTIYGIF